MLDLILIEKFVSEMMPPAGRETIHMAFKQMKDPQVNTMTIGSFISELQMRLFQSQEMEQVVGTRNFMTGIMLCFASENEFLRKLFIEDYLERGKKLRGEHVVDFHHWKAGK